MWPASFQCVRLPACPATRPLTRWRTKKAIDFWFSIGHRSTPFTNYQNVKWTNERWFNLFLFRWPLNGFGDNIWLKTLCTLWICFACFNVARISFIRTDFLSTRLTEWANQVQYYSVCPYGVCIHIRIVGALPPPPPLLDIRRATLKIVMIFYSVDSVRGLNRLQVNLPTNCKTARTNKPMQVSPFTLHQPIL